MAAPAATEVDITAYQKDTRGGAEGKEWHTVTVAVKCMATGGQWMDVMLFPMRCYSRPIPLQPGEIVLLSTLCLQCACPMPASACPHSGLS